MSTWRFFPPKKPPRLPPKGEKWSGLLRPATLVTAAAVAALIVAVGIGVTVSRPSAPTTLEGVTAEVVGEADTLTTLLGDPVEPPSDSTSVSPCPDGGAGEQFTLERTVLLPATARPAEVIDIVKAAYEAREWNVSVSPRGADGGVQAQVVGKNLIPITIVVQPSADAGASTAGEGVEATITSSSRCTAP
ncbi:hypothetical protein [Herbiconiux daphne]|uniref:Uncharacterized protein n=1 Tax=Herbiconiux daphne TaxID=2970914 RepID=A0ABT2H7X9_9MICO|nr:hypothetical protein [Herbiconiux daphne]MCS5736041.1 hypothetical protein [Herbiconiux daphne]